MLDWIANNAVTIISISVVMLIIGIAVFSLVKDKKNSSGGCTGNCASCKMGCSCNKNISSFK